MSDTPNQPTPAGFDATPLAEPTQAELDLMSQQFALLGADGESVKLGQLKPFYKKRGWTYILARVNALVDAGVLSVRTVQGAQGGSWNEYTYQGE